MASRSGLLDLRVFFFEYSADASDSLFPISHSKLGNSMRILSEIIVSTVQCIKGSHSALRAYFDPLIIMLDTLRKEYYKLLSLCDT